MSFWSRLEFGGFMNGDYYKNI